MIKIIQSNLFEYFSGKVVELVFHTPYFGILQYGASFFAYRIFVICYPDWVLIFQLLRGALKFQFFMSFYLYGA